MNEKKLDGKVALITGASKGLGKAMALALAEAGATVALVSRNLEQLNESGSAVKAADGDARVFQADVSDEDQVRKLERDVAGAFGKVHILINNAGISAEELGSGKVSTTTPDVIHRTFETNFFAPVALTQALLPLLKKSDAGRIVNMSSILGSQTLHADPNSPIYGVKSLSYDASKAALNSFTIHLAHELKDTSIKVNSAHPGWVKTDMGTDAAPMEIPEGAKTGVQLALLGADGPTGGYFHLGKALPW